MPAVTSLQVAEAFGKKHFHVLRDIREIMLKCSESFNASNFGFSTTKDAKGEERPMRLLSKDGLLMVTMGYTTPDAMRVKEAYIRRFNEMEAELARRFPCLQGGKPAPLIPRKDGGARRGGRFGKVKHRKR